MIGTKMLLAQASKKAHARKRNIIAVLERVLLKTSLIDEPGETTPRS
jgi:hypothetical protein